MVMDLIGIHVHDGVFEWAVHAFHLAIGPEMVGLGEAVLDAKLLADALKAMLKSDAWHTSAAQVTRLVTPTQAPWVDSFV